MRPHLTSSEVARLCSVDLKTVHNWVSRGRIPFARTPGGHLRFDRVGTEALLRDRGLLAGPDPARDLRIVSAWLLSLVEEQLGGRLARDVGLVVPDEIAEIVRRAGAL